MANFYGPTGPNGANDGDQWTNQTTGEASIWANGAWVSVRPISTIGAAPTAAAGSDAGGSPPAPVVVAGSTDTRGQLTFGAGTSPGSIRLVDVTFRKPYPVMPFVAVAACSSAAIALNPYVATQNTTGFTIGTLTPPAGSAGNGTYRVNYGVIG